MKDHPALGATSRTANAGEETVLNCTAETHARDRTFDGREHIVEVDSTEGSAAARDDDTERRGQGMRDLQDLLRCRCEELESLRQEMAQYQDVCQL